MNKKWLIIVVIFVLLALISGGTDAVDINRMIFVVGVGVDAGENGLRYTFYTAVPTGSDTAISENNVDYHAVTLESASMAAAVRQLEQGSSREISFEHLNCAALGKSVIDGDHGAMLDYLLNSSSVRRQCAVLALDCPAQEFFSVQYDGSIASAAATALERMDDSGSRSSTMTLGRLDDALDGGHGYCLYVMKLAQGLSEVTPTDVHSASTIELRGLAVYKSDGLGGILDRDRAELARLFTHGQVSGLITSVNEHNEEFYYEITYSKCRSEFIPGDPCRAEITLEAHCVPVDSAGALHDPPDEAALSDSLSRQLTELATISRIYGSALTGLEEEAMQSSRLWYESIKDNWDELYLDTQIQVTARCTIEQSGKE